MSEQAVVMDKQGDICNVPIPSASALLKRCGNPVCLYKSTQMVDGNEFCAVSPVVVRDFHVDRAKKALVAALESSCFVEHEDYGGYSTASASVIAMRPDAFEKLIETVYRAGLEDGANL